MLQTEVYCLCVIYKLEITVENLSIPIFFELHNIGARYHFYHSHIVVTVQLS